MAHDASLTPARRLRSASLSVAILGLAAAAPAFAAPKPAQLTATFNDRDGPKGKVGEKASGCTVNFAEIVDERRSPELVGVIERRAVRAPADVQAWMRAVLGGLPARGVDVRFDAAPARARSRPASPSRPPGSRARSSPTAPASSFGCRRKARPSGATAAGWRGRPIGRAEPERCKAPSTAPSPTPSMRWRWI